MAAITLTECIDILESSEWLTRLRVITANLEKNTGGKVLEFRKCKIARHQDPTADKPESPSEFKGNRMRKDPQHGIHFTRNIEFPNKRIVKIHPIIITHINNHSLL